MTASRRLETLRDLKGIIEGCFPQVHVRTIKRILTGWDNHVVEVNGELIFRFSKRPDSEKRLRKEVLLLPKLARVLPLPVPHFDYIWRGNREHRRMFVGYRKLEGTQLNYDLLMNSNADEVARQFAEFLNQLHSFPVMEARRLQVPFMTPVSWKAEYRSLGRQFRELVYPQISKEDSDTCVSLLKDFRNSEVSFHPSLIHMDLGSGNVLADPGSGLITGILDWGDATIGDPAFDFSGLMYEYGGDFVEKVLGAHEASMDKTFWQRLVFYSSMIPYHLILGAEMIGLPYQVKKDEVVLKEGSKYLHFKMGEYSAALRLTESK